MRDLLITLILAAGCWLCIYFALSAAGICVAPAFGFFVALLRHTILTIFPDAFRSEYV